MRSRFPDEDQPPHSFPGHNTPVSHDTTKAGLFSCNFSLPTASKLVLDGRWSKQEELKTGSEDRMTRSPSNERGSLPKMHTERMRIASFTTVDGSVFAPDRGYLQTFDRLLLRVIASCSGNTLVARRDLFFFDC